jgi:hypothetical protein
MKNKEHPNTDIIKLKLRELRREEIPVSAQHLLDDIERLVINNPTPLKVPNESN